MPSHNASGGLGPQYVPAWCDRCTETHAPIDGCRLDWRHERWCCLAYEDHGCQCTCHVRPDQEHHDG